MLINEHPSRMPTLHRNFKKQLRSRELILYDCVNRQTTFISSYNTFLISELLLGLKYKKKTILIIAKS